MLYTIYRVTHKESGKVYIGKHQTLNVDDHYMGSGQLIRRAVKKYGVEAFEKEVLHVFETEAEMNAKEAELVTEEFCSREDTYNLCPGGNGGWGYVNKNKTPEEKKRVGSLGGFASGKVPKDKILEGARRGGLAVQEKIRKGELDSKIFSNDSFTGCRHTEESKAAISSKMRVQKRVQCPYCDISGIASNMKRWHFENCKMNL